MILVLMDFDGTITKKDTFIEFIRFNKSLLSFYLGFFILSPIILAYKLKIVPNWKAKEIVFSYFFKGLKEEIIVESGNMFTEEHLPKLLRQEAVDEITKHKKNGIKIGRLSGISAHYVPKYLQKNRLPSWETNCIEDWETKVDTIIDETINENMTIIAGIPSWVQMYFEKINKKTGKPIGEVFKNFNLFIYGGVNFEPYRTKFENLIGRKVDSIELYPASEGFFAFQDKQHEKGMLLLLNSGIFYEFVKADEFFNENPKRITIEDVELGVNYVMIISTNAGLWAYNVGDTVEFTSLNPHRIIVTGRIKHFISAFGEHVIGKEVEQAMQEATKQFNINMTEFTVAPQLNPVNGLPYHEWFIEFETEPNNIQEIETFIDQSLQVQNSYYLDLIKGKVLQPLKISVVEKDGFNKYMSKIGKLGGQNKVPRLANDRKIANILSKYIKAN